MKTGINMGNDMKRISNRVSGLCLACVVFLVSCMKETDTFRPQAAVDGDRISFNAVNADNAETRTSRQADGAVWWDPADNIHIFYGSVSSKFTNQIKSPSATATFSGSFEGLVYDGSGEFWALYPYSETDSFDGNSLTFSLSSKQKAVAGTFDRDVFPAIARSSDLKLKFRNVCGGIKFCVNSEGISRVTFKGNRSEALAGTVKVVLDKDGIPSVFKVLQPKTELSLAAPDGKTFQVGKWYHLVALPGTLQSGYTMTLIYNDNHREIVKSNKAVEIKRSTFGTLTNVNEKATETQTPAGGTQSGLYLGIIGFNEALYYYPIRKLNMDTLEGFNSFIDGLGQKNTTLLYYSIKEAIRTLQVANYPHNISSASIVTFTDGEDDGSAYYEKFPGNDEAYLSDVNSRLYEEKVAGLPLSAWTIGLKSSDAEFHYDKFLRHLQQLSRPESNGVIEDDMSAVNRAFERIAQELIQSFSIYNVRVNMAGKADKTKVRITLDNVSTPDASSKYIEGFFDMYNDCLYDVSYHGLSCSSGTRVQGNASGTRVTFDFSDIRLDDNSEIRREWIKLWIWDEAYNNWQPKSETDPLEEPTVEIVKESAVVLLNLDCTTSLGGKFATLKTHAKSFIYKLCQAAYDASQVSSVTLSKSSLNLYEGDVSTLTATVRPSTATERSVTWSSSDESVVTVTQTGRVTAVSPGTATVKVMTKDGGYSATCQITVLQVMVDLGLSVKWATRNVGASSPEGYGNYYAWGETSPKSNYAWSTYKWCNGSETTLTKYNTMSDYGTVDHRMVLDLSDDAAHVNWGGKWRMPTDMERAELRNNCTWTWTTQNGVNGYRVTSNKTGYTDKSIFLPATGYRNKTSLLSVGLDGYYWIASPLNVPDPVCASGIYFKSSNVSESIFYRYYGQSIRPVYGDFIFVESISLNKSSISIKEGATYQLSPTVMPTTATDKSVSWSSSNTNVATVNSIGKVTGVSAGTATITVWSSDGKKSATCQVTVEREAVDLGLSVKWAPYNVGATKPEEYGNYYAWGETSTKSNYDWPTYRWCNGSNTTMTKYNTLSDYGAVDHRMVLDLSDDVAHMNWGSKWRMPTDSEWAELRDNCTWTWTTQNSIKGYKVTSKSNGNSIFIPAAGDFMWTSTSAVNTAGDYWSSTLDIGGPSCAWNRMLSASAVVRLNSVRSVGRSIRPVYGDFITVESISLSKSSLSIMEGEASQLSANVRPSNATVTTVTWSSSNTKIATVDSNGWVKGVSAGTATITAWSSDGKKPATCVVTVKPFHESVDLGLSVKWATCNVGASSPEEYGEYFAWGETESKSNYAWSTYKWCNGTYENLTKYCDDSSYGYNGFTDNKTVLDLEDDAAHVNWGGSWRMPTDAEWTELRENCTWTWIRQNGVIGARVTSNKAGFTGKSIFLPAAGFWNNNRLVNEGIFGGYWSSSLYTDDHDLGYARRLFFNSEGVKRDYYYRYNGFSIRPVSE